MINESTLPSTSTEALTHRLTIAPYGEGRLSGLTFAVKDLIDIAGYPTSCGNPDWLASHPPAVANAVCVDQLLAEGATCIGKSVTDQLAFSLHGENYFYGSPLNPRAPERVSGGSSSGSASAVAQGLCDFAIGTDTGGSVRVPASNCGIWGWRSTHGLVSVAGVNPLSPTFDTVSFFASKFSVLRELGRVFFNQLSVTSNSAKTIYFVREAWDLADKTVVDGLQEHTEVLRKIAAIKEISIREIDQESEEITGMGNWLQTYNSVQRAEIWSCLGSWVESEKPELGPLTSANFELAKSESRTQLAAHGKRRDLYFRRLYNFLSVNDFICIPTAPCVAPLKGSLPANRQKSDYYQRALSLTSIAGIGRLPQISMPIGTAEGAPIGLSLITRTGNDEGLFNLVDEFLQVIDRAF